MNIICLKKTGISFIFSIRFKLILEQQKKTQTESQFSRIHVLFSKEESRNIILSKRATPKDYYNNTQSTVVDLAGT